MARDRSEPSRTRYSQPSGNFAGTSQLVDVLDDGSLVLANVEGIDFGTNLSVTDNGDGTVTVAASASGGGGFVADPAFDIENQTFTDLGMSDDFSDGSLDAQWTPVNLSAGAVDLFSTPGSNIYQEDGNRGTLFVQATSGVLGLDAGFRVDNWLSNGEEIVVACSPGEQDTDSNNAHHLGLVANDDDTGINAGTFVQIYYDGSDNGNIKIFDGGVGRTVEDAGIFGRRIYFRFTRLNDTLYSSVSVSGASWAVVDARDATVYNNFWLIYEADGHSTGNVGQFYWVRHAATNGEHDPFQA